MAHDIKLIVYPITELEKAKKFFSTFLGESPYVEGSFYVGYRAGNMEIGLDPNSNVGPIAYIDVADIEESLDKLTGAGAEIVQDVKDVANGLLMAQVKDPNGNVVGLRQQPRQPHGEGRRT